MASGVAKRYGDAVFELASESGSVDAWSADLARLSALMEDPEGAAMMRDPRVSESDKLKLVDAVLADGQPQARNLAHLLVERDRMDSTVGINEHFKERVLESRGVAVADVTTAVPLGEQELAKIARQLSDVVGKTVEVRASVDPSIVGGVVAQVGDILIDGSVSSQLRRLRERLSATA